ncbi:hypothetical protein AZE42_13759 [Rhizopogon vesiculosus]|uniref:Uncharacterized protein n=1 Tax=Rhizopogon vesiculosus TaxID=180088 RepID=A0A1J8R6Z4_9AGAM|nr:hypothetical protein AZE42_13759 [Rhizopogon vesiculosus]
MSQAKSQLEMQRAREAEKAYATAAAQYAEQQAAAASVASVSMTERARDSTISEAMDVDTSATVNRKGKQKAEEERPAETAEGKKPRLETPSLPLKRDRENCTVFVADLPSEVT